MIRIIRRIAVVCGLLVLAGAIGLAFLYRTATTPVPEYQAALQETHSLAIAGELDARRQELESQIAALVSDAQQQEKWRTVVTAKQINSWLAMQLPDEFPSLSEQGIRDPRVVIKPGVVMLALRADTRMISAVVSFELTPYLTPSGELALELSAARVGSMSVPKQRVLEPLAKTIRSQGLPGRWTRNQGLPVLLLSLDELVSTDLQSRKLDSIEVREGEIYIAGQTIQTTTPTEEPCRVAELPN